VGTLVMISLEPLRKKVRFTAAIAAVALSTLMLLPGATANSLRERFDPNYMQAQGYGHRIFITQDYLEQWPSYIVNGMGYSRAVEAVRNSYNRMARLYVPHSAYLSVFVEFGAPGLFLFLWSIYHIWQFVNPSRNGRQRLPADSLIAGFLAAWIVYFLTGNFGERIFWLSWAVIAAYGHLRPPSFDNPLVTTGSHQKAAAGGVR